MQHTARQRGEGNEDRIVKPEIRHLTWPNFSETILVPGENRLHKVPGSPETDIFCDNNGRRLGFRTVVNDRFDVPADLDSLAFINFDFIDTSEKLWLEASTTTPALFREFYAIAVNVTDRVQVDNKSPESAIQEEFKALRQLLAKEQLLSPEQERGLVGELWILRRLIKALGPVAVKSWTGPLAEPHDFRLQAHEIEVKTTINSQRIHTISSMQQLVASPGLTLYVASLQLQPAAGASGGFGLPSLIKQIRNLLNGKDANVFDDLLEKSLFRDSDRDRYTLEYVLRTPVALISVDEECPRLTPDILKRSMGTTYPRLASIKYEVNLDGLGVTEGDQAFNEKLPGETE